MICRAEMSLTNLTNSGKVIIVDLAKRYCILPVKQTSVDMQGIYWNALIKGDTLKLRMNEVAKPSIDDVVTMLGNNLATLHYILDLDEDRIVGEFTVVPLSGKLGSIHFSSHPINPFRLNIALGKFAVHSVFNEWKSGDMLGGSYLTSLVGLTPARNRPACLFIRKVGFKRVMEIEDGCCYDGELSRAVMTIMHSTSN